MSRPKTLLNIPRQPRMGSPWIIQNLITNELCKCSATAHPDKPHVEALRRFSGTDPFFTAKIGSKYTGITYFKFLCSPSLQSCLDVTLTWKWLDLTKDEADIKRLWYSEPNLLTEKIQEFEKPLELPETPFITIKELI